MSSNNPLVLFWGIISFAIIHTTIAVWWASGVESRVSSLPLERAREFAIRDTRIDSTNQRIDAIERVMNGALLDVKTSIFRIETKVDKIYLRGRNE